MYEHNGNVYKEIENLKRNQKGILELKITITEIKIHYRNLETDLSTQKKDSSNAKIRHY